MLLVDLVSLEIAGFFLIFCRVGAALMVLPVFGENYVATQARLWLALATSLVLTAVVDNDPGRFADPAFLAAAVALEIVTGLFIGAMVRLLLMATHVAGGIIALQSGLASAAFFDPTEGTSSSGIGNLLTMVVLLLLLMSDGHHMMLLGLAESYRIVPTASLSIADAAEAFTRLFSLAFETALRIAAPLIVVGILLNVVTGVMNRLMPTFQVMFVIMPLQITVALLIVMLSLGVTGELALEFFATSVAWLDGG